MVTQGISSPTLWWSYFAEGVAYHHTVSFPFGTDMLPENLEALKLRMSCLHLLSSMPSEGLEEAYNVLRDMFTFYTERPKSLAPPPVTTQVPAKLGKTYERPPFHIDEE